MELRPELQPPSLDEAKVARLAALADNLDGRNAGWEDDLVEFNRVAGTDFPIEHFQGIYGGDGHEDWVRRVLLYEAVRPVPDVTREELVEVVRRAMSQDEYLDERDAYMAIFGSNVPRDGASNLIFYPPDYDPATNTWGGGRPMGEYDPTPEQVVEWALSAGSSGDRT